MPTPPDALAKYGAVIIPRKPPTLGKDSGTMIARVGLLEFLDLTQASQGEIKFSGPFSKKPHTRNLYPGGPDIPVLGTSGMVTTVGRLNSLRTGASWQLVIGGQSYGIRVSDLRAEDLQEALKAATGIGPNDYFVTKGGGIYQIKASTGAGTLRNAVTPPYTLAPAPPQLGSMDPVA